MPFRLLDLPLELREQIYSAYLNPADRHRVLDSHGGGRYYFEFGLLRTCRRVYDEAVAVWRRENVFVRIDTPWPDAVHHISSEGMVPIVAAGVRGALFKHHHALVHLAAPFRSSLPEHSIILLLNDVHLFTETWHYSSLSYPDLNRNLCATFVLRDPYYPADPKPNPLELQRRILEPFGTVKELHRVEFEGFDEEAVQEIRRAMAVPKLSLTECCEDAVAKTEEGDRLLAETKLKDALQSYVQALHAIHILVDGRRRRVLADGFFHDGIESGRFRGQSGTTVRLVLRIRLVSKIVFVYLKLDEFAEATFWGMRSIRIMREAMDTEFEDFLAEFIGSGDVGLIYARTAIAFYKMEGHQGDGSPAAKELEAYREDDEDLASSETLWALASRYLKGPERENERRLVRKEAKAFGAKMSGDLTGEHGDLNSLSRLNLEIAEAEITEGQEVFE